MWVDVNTSKPLFEQLCLGVRASGFKVIFKRKESFGIPVYDDQTSGTMFYDLVSWMPIPEQDKSFSYEEALKHLADGKRVRSVEWSENCHLFSVSYLNKSAKISSPVPSYTLNRCVGGVSMWDKENNNFHDGLKERWEFYEDKA